MAKEAYSVEGFCEAYSVGKTTAYEEINSGRLKAKKKGRRTLIPSAAAQAWLASCDPLVAGQAA